MVRVGLGLPAAVPGVDAPGIGYWAERAEEVGFSSLSVLDRLVYDNLDPLVVLAAAAGRTTRVELLTTILNVPYRRSALVLAKQLASLDAISNGRLTAGLALGGWPQDYRASGLAAEGRAAEFDHMLAVMRSAWAGQVALDGAEIPATPPGRPGLLFGGLTPGAFRRAASEGFDGWIAPFFGFDVLSDGIASVCKAWAVAGRPGAPRIVAERYFCLGSDADTKADEYLAHYYGREFYQPARADTLTSPAEIENEIVRLADAGCDDVVLFPCDGKPSQVDLLGEALSASGRLALPGR
jgi:alkanesulfonate monooxygenase SsuD/methylene tetrahydromethanopterin reductase-like flavin-dependent oxidoreductase (luciferase family)